MTYRTITAEVDVDIDLTDFETDELIEELENRGHMVDNNSKSLVFIIYQKRRIGKDYQSELDSLIYSVLGEIT